MAGPLRLSCIDPSLVDVRGGGLVVHVGSRPEAEKLAGRLAPAGFPSHVHDAGPPDEALLASCRGASASRSTTSPAACS